jgi:uncharacterized membrane protein
MGVTRDILDKTDLFKKAVIVALSGLGIGPGVYSAYDVAHTGASLDQAVEALQFKQGLLDSFGMITAVSILAILCHFLYIDKKKEEGYYFLEARAWFTFCAFSTLVIIIIPEGPGGWGMLDDFTDLYPLVRAAQYLRRGILLQSIPGFIESIYSLKIIRMLRKEGPLTKKQIVDSCCKESPFSIIDSIEDSDSLWNLQSPKGKSGGYTEHQLRNFHDQMIKRKFRKFCKEFIIEELGVAKGFEPPKKKAIENFLRDLCDWGIVVKIQGKYMLFPIDAYRFEHEDNTSLARKILMKLKRITRRY